MIMAYLIGQWVGGGGGGGVLTEVLYGKSPP